MTGYNAEIAPRAPQEVLSSLGFPNITLPQDYPTCDSIGTPKCTRAGEFVPFSSAGFIKI